MRAVGGFPMKNHLTLAFVFLITLGCSGGRLDSTSDSTITTGPTDPNVTNRPPELNLTDKGFLTLPKADLQKEYLLQASFIQQDFGVGIQGSPTSRGIQSKIVYFIQEQPSLFMMESTKKYLTSDEFPSDRILAEFKIIDENGQTITFDFNEGMKNILMVADRAASDYEKEMPERMVLEVKHSFIKLLEKTNDRIQIQQVAQVIVENRSDPVKIVYYLEPYQANPNYTPVQSPGFSKVGFFETQPLVKPEYGTTYYNITRWDITKPIVFHLSANTPKEYVEAVEDGILYWNKAFGRDLISVKMAPEGITAPHHDYNMVQWVTNNGAGMAYADAQMDPRTGEIKHAQVYITSVFPVATMDRVLRVLPELGNDGAQKAKNQFTSLALNQFPSGTLCRHPYHSARETGILKDLNLFTANLETAKKMAGDMVRHVVAHEIGHVLGLRHNFAGSHSSHHHPREIKQAFEDYLKTGESDTALVSSSSVMDYTARNDRVLNGRFIKNGAGALPHDQLAIDWAYGNQTAEGNPNETLFCTDSHEGFYLECHKFDDPGHPLVNHSAAFRENVKRLPNVIAELYKTAKMFHNKEMRIAVSEVPLHANFYAHFLTQELAKTLDVLKTSSRSLYVERRFDMISDINQEEVVKATNRWIDQAIAKEGGIAKLLDLIHDTTLHQHLKEAARRFAEIVDSSNFREGVDLHGDPYIFTETEINIMKRNATKLFAKLADKVILQTTQEISKNGYFFGAESTESAKVLEQISNPYPLEENSFRKIADLEGLEATLGNWAEFVIVDHAEDRPTFNAKTRMEATDILQAEQGPTKEWQQKNQKKVRDLLISKLEKRFGHPLGEISTTHMSPEEAELFELEVQILRALNYSPEPSQSEPPN